MPREKLFVDSSVFLAAAAYPESNSRLVLGAILNGVLEAVVSQKVVEEVKAVTLRTKGSREAYWAERFLRRKFKIVAREEIRNEIAAWRGKIKDQDLEHLATAKKFGLRIVAFDRDYAAFKEYVTPKQLVKELSRKFGLKPFDSEY